jgi:hypothetical protein
VPRFNRLNDDLKDQIVQFVELNDGKIEMNDSSKDQIDRFVKLNDG